jgi:type I restriction enzyme R subunit
MAELGVDRANIDQWFERATRGLSAEQQRDLKRKFSRHEEISAAEQRIAQIAYDISRHYVENHQGTGRKAQLAASSKATAIHYQRYFEDFGDITSAVIISAPDTREGHAEPDETRVPEVHAFWKRMMQQYGTEAAYNRELRSQFHRKDGLDLLIVVDKLLTGFDEPRNTVLYIDKPLKDHSLLQAIARVNRVFAGKDYGYVIDYRGVLGDLNAALNTYDALEGFDADDVAGVITDVRAEIARLPQHHAALWAIFDGVVNKQDSETLQRHLEPVDRRQAFYDALAQFARCLNVALSAVAFYTDTPSQVIAVYKRDFKAFHNLRVAVQHRYAEVIDYHDYEQKIRSLMNTHIQSSEVVPITEQVNIFDTEAFAAEVERVSGVAAKADTIANRLKRTLTERMEHDPATYQRFSHMIDDTIRAYREGRLSEADYLAQASALLAQVQTGAVVDVPDKLHSRPDARAFFSTLRDLPMNYTNDQAPPPPDVVADIALDLDQIITTRKVRDWTRNLDIQNTMRNDLEDYLYAARAAHGLPLTPDDIERMVDTIIELAKQRARIQ